MSTNLLLAVPVGSNHSSSDSNAALDSDNENGDFPVGDTLFLVFISIIGCLATITAALLIHLCFFHIYISFLGVTTYEYIRSQRQQQTQSATTSNGQAQGAAPQPPPSQETVRTTNQLPTVGSVTEIASATTATEKSTRRLRGRRKITRSRSIDRIVFCSTIKSTSPVTETPLSYLVENKVNVLSAATVPNEVIAPDIVGENGNGTIGQAVLKSQCVICSLVQIGPGRPDAGKDLLCCTKIYNREEADVKVGDAPDIEVVEETLVVTESSEGSSPSKSPQLQRWRSKLYCCVTVPNSPDAAVDVSDALRGFDPSDRPRGSRENPGNLFRIPVTDDPKTTAGHSLYHYPPIRPTRRAPVGKYHRLRRLLRMVKFQRNVDETLIKGGSGLPTSRDKLKVNQVRPLTSNMTTNPLPSQRPSQIPSVGQLAPSPRRKRPRADLKEYVVYLTSAANDPQNGCIDSTAVERSPCESFSPPLSNKLEPNLFTRRTRKKAFRNQLSPIKESGMSNPNSPGPCRAFPAIT